LPEPGRFVLFMKSVRFLGSADYGKDEEWRAQTDLPQWKIQPNEKCLSRAAATWMVEETTASWSLPLTLKLRTDEQTADCLIDHLTIYCIMTLHR
jgi:hypothetical protein